MDMSLDAGKYLILEFCYKKQVRFSGESVGKV